MKISKVDPYNLIVEDNPLYPGIVGFPLSMIALYKLIQLISEGNVFNKEFFGTLVGFIITLFVTGFMTQFRKFHFNVGEKHLYWRCIGLFGFKSGTVPFSNIKKVVFEASPSWRTGKTHATIRLALSTNEGTIPLTHYNSGSIFKKECESIAKLVDDALGEDHSRFIEDSILELVSAGKKIQAVILAKEHYGFTLTEAKKFIDELKPS